jgi:hypothetical protein
MRRLQPEIRILSGSDAVLAAYATSELPNFDIFSVSYTGIIAPKAVMKISYVNNHGVKFSLETGRFHQGIGAGHDCHRFRRTDRRA